MWGRVRFLLANQQTPVKYLMVVLPPIGLHRVTELKNDESVSSGNTQLGEITRTLVGELMLPFLGCGLSGGNRVAISSLGEVPTPQVYHAGHDDVVEC